MDESLRILVVDDDPSMANTTADILAASGYIVETASDAWQGLGKLEANSFHCVLTDIRMQGMNGVDFQKMIREKYSDLHVLLMTAYADYDLIARGRQQGATAFLEKPLDISLLLSILRAIELEIFHFGRA